MEATEEEIENRLLEIADAKNYAGWFLIIISIIGALFCFLALFMPALILCLAILISGIVLVKSGMNDRRIMLKRHNARMKKEKANKKQRIAKAKREFMSGSESSEKSLSANLKKKMDFQVEKKDESRADLGAHENQDTKEKTFPKTAASSESVSHSVPGVSGSSPSPFPYPGNKKSQFSSPHKLSREAPEKSDFKDSFRKKEMKNDEIKKPAGKEQKEPKNLRRKPENEEKESVEEDGEAGEGGPNIKEIAGKDGYEEKENLGKDKENENEKNENVEKDENEEKENEEFVETLLKKFQSGKEEDESNND